MKSNDMAGRDDRKRRSVPLVIAGIVVLLAIAAIGTAVAVLSQYVTTRDADSSTAAREFEAARAQFAGQLPLIEYGGFERPIVHRRRSPTNRQIIAIHALAYSVTEGQLSRLDMPVGILRLTTIGGRLGLMDLGTSGEGRDRITLDDLERHGPGLVLDAAGRDVGALAIADSLLGTGAKDSRLLIWTE